MLLSMSHLSHLHHLSRVCSEIAIVLLELLPLLDLDLSIDLESCEGFITHSIVVESKSKMSLDLNPL